MRAHKPGGLRQLGFADDKISGGKFAANTIMNLVGLTEVGAPFALIYFGIDVKYPKFWGGVADFIGDMQKENERNADDPLWHLH